MAPRQRGRSFGHNPTSGAPPPPLTPGQGSLYRIRTPLEHVDGIVVYDDDHHPHDSPNLQPVDTRTPWPFGAPLHEEDEETATDRQNTDSASDETVVPEGDTALPDGTAVGGVIDQEKQVRQRQGWSGGRNDAEERGRIRRIEKQGKDGRGQVAVSEKAAEQGGVVEPRTRKWKDDIVTYDTVDDPTNPKNWPYFRKVMITMLFGTTTMCSTFASSVFSSASPYIQEEFGVGRQVVVLGISLFIGGYVLGPLLWSSLSEQYGRTATAKDLQSYLGWRWTMYLTVILTGFVLLIDIFILPETFSPAILTRKARHLRLETRRWALHSRHEERNTEFSYFVEQYLTLPLRMIATEPMVTCITLILYMLFGAIPIVYEENRGWSPVAGTLPFLSVLVGCFIAAAINVYYSNTIFRRALENSPDGKAKPEMRLPPMMIGSVTFPIGFFIVGWTSDPSIHWFPSVLGFTFIGMSFLLIFQAGLNYLIDSYTSRAASAVGYERDLNLSISIET
ncbi:hypothetical protein QFC21_001797 [Naganishia friedmannii]|uniref:Uncharacterized protein n=1 Tax=Naganishia friedmannii TaxID=89922 RepID=A0ACC2W226_9TREE|nr:hypothetical protein QFC21_001797 [Naganishia friedmannii]